MGPWTMVVFVVWNAAGAAPPEKPPESSPDGVALVGCEAAPEGMACVAGGPFKRGADADTHFRGCHQIGRPRMSAPDTAPAATVWLQTFYMDKLEITYAAFRACQKSGKCTNPKAGPHYNDFNRPRQPITGVSWYDAVEYCRVHGKHLPTEAEWEKAARGPDGALYPWGDARATCARTVMRDDRLGGRSCGVKKQRGGPEIGRVLEVGSRPAGVYGLFDMVGNVEEWTADWYSTSWDACGAACLGTNPKGPCGGKEPCAGHEYRSVRGGSWYWRRGHATGIHRRPHFPENKPFHHFGFRCAASPEEARKLAR